MTFRLIIAFFLSIGSLCFAQTCDEWFKDLKLTSNSKNCLSVCNTAVTDMGTFSCHSECDRLCRPKKENKCKTDLSKIKFGKIPENWPWSKDNTTQLDQHDSDFVNATLSRINPNLIDSIHGLYFVDKPKDLFSIGTEASYYEGQIIIYKKAFENKGELLNKLVHELGHHLHETTESSNFTEYSKKYFIKNRKYLTADSKFNAEEDFATNFEIYINNPSQLKAEIPTIFEWFTKKFGNKYNLRECQK